MVLNKIRNLQKEKKNILLKKKPLKRLYDFISLID